MTNLPPPPKKISKNIIIAVAVIAIVLIALVAGVMMGLSANQPANTPTPTPSPTATITSSPKPSSTVVPYDFKMSANYPSFNITQGGGFYVSIDLKTVSGNVQSVNAHDVIWTADSGSSGIQCDFDTTGVLYGGTETDANGFSIPSGFSNLLLITVPKSTPTNNYAITVTAKIGSTSHSMSILVAVESSTVAVSGTVNPSYSNITPYQIEFLRIQSVSQEKYYATLTGNTYSISVPNHEKYVVSVSDGKGQWYMCSSDFWLQVPAGSTSMTRDFTVFGS